MAKDGGVGYGMDWTDRLAQGRLCAPAVDDEEEGGNDVAGEEVIGRGGGGIAVEDDVELWDWLE